MTKLNHKNLIIEIPEELHKELKLWALERNMTLKHYVMQALIRLILEEKKSK